MTRRVPQKNRILEDIVFGDGLAIDSQQVVVGFAVANVLLEELEEKRPHLVFSCMQGKESPLMIEAMQGKIASLTLFALPQERVEPVTRLAALAEQLLPELPRLNADSLQEAMDRVVNSVSAEEMVVLCGSLFVWEALLQQNEFRLVESLTFERR